jgi:hypothetical protein
MLSVIMLSIIMLSVINAECHHAECHHAECHHAECHHAECHPALTDLNEPNEGKRLGGVGSVLDIGFHVGYDEQEGDGNRLLSRFLKLRSFAADFAAK